MPTGLYRNVYKNPFFKYCLNVPEWKEKYINDINRLALEWNSLLEEYGALVRIARESLHMSKVSFSEECGITIGQITYIESGTFKNFIHFYEAIDNSLECKLVAKCFVTYPEYFIKVRDYLINNGIYTSEVFKALVEGD